MASESSIEKIQFLQQVGLFKSLSDKALLDLAAVTIEQQIPSKTTVFKEGDKGDALYIVKSGKVNILKRNSAGIDSILVAAICLCRHHTGFHLPHPH